MPWLDMNPTPSRKYASRTSGRPFAPGNPGRPKGARNKTTMAVEALLEGEAEALTRRAIQAALGGDTTALRLCSDRIAPAPRERRLQFDAPVVASAQDVPAALSAVIAAVAGGELTPGEGAVVAGLLDRFRAAYEAVELERRLAAIERAMENRLGR